RLPRERHLAVLAPAAPGATEDFAAYALGATEVLSTRLMRHQDQPGFQMATFAESYAEQLASAADAHRALGVNLVLAPTLEQRENRLGGCAIRPSTAIGRKSRGSGRSSRARLRLQTQHEQGEQEIQEEEVADETTPGVGDRGGPGHPGIARSA